MRMTSVRSSCWVTCASGLGSCYVTATAQTATDASGNSLVAVADGSGLEAASFTDDTTSPTLSAFVLNLNAGTLLLTFSETVRLMSFGSTKLAIKNVMNLITDTSQCISPTGTVQVTYPAATTLLVQLTTFDLNTLKLTGPLVSPTVGTYLSFSVRMVRDMCANICAAVANGQALVASDLILDII